MDSSLSLLAMLAQTLLALGFVCLLAFVIFRVILPRVNPSFSSNSMIRIVDRTPLDMRKSLYIIEVAGRWMLISVTESNVQLISELDSESAEYAEKILAERRHEIVQTNPLNTFAARLAEAFNRKGQGK